MQFNLVKVVLAKEYATREFDGRDGNKVLFKSREIMFSDGLSTVVGELQMRDAETWKDYQFKEGYRYAVEGRMTTRKWPKKEGQENSEDRWSNEFVITRLVELW